MIPFLVVAYLLAAVLGTLLGLAYAVLWTIRHR